MLYCMSYYFFPSGTVLMNEKYSISFSVVRGRYLLIPTRCQISWRSAYFRIYNIILDFKLKKILDEFGQSLSSYYRTILKSTREYSSMIKNTWISSLRVLMQFTSGSDASVYCIMVDISSTNVLRLRFWVIMSASVFIAKQGHC